MLQSIALQRVRQDLSTEQQQVWPGPCIRPCRVRCCPLYLKYVSSRWKPLPFLQDPPSSMLCLGICSVLPYINTCLPGVTASGSTQYWFYYLKHHCRDSVISPTHPNQHTVSAVDSFPVCPGFLSLLVKQNK